MTPTPPAPWQLVTRYADGARYRAPLRAHMRPRLYAYLTVWGDAPAQLDAIGYTQTFETLGEALDVAATYYIAEEP